MRTTSRTRTSTIPPSKISCHRTKHTPGTGKLTVSLRDGTRISETLSPPSDLIGPELVMEKFRRCTVSLLSEARIAKIIDMIKALELVPSTRSLSRELRSSVH